MSAPDYNPTDPLEAMVRTADADAPPPPVPADLAGRVRARGRRRRRNRRVIAGSVIAVTLAALLGSFLRTGHDSRPPQLAKVDPPVAPVPAATKMWLADLDMMRAEADARLASATRLVALQRRRDMVRRLDAIIVDSAVPRPDRAAAVRAEAALTLLGQGDRLKVHANDTAAALATYRRAAELFADTPAASVARQRIAQLQSELRSELQSELNAEEVRS